jgi:hypothetical protein
VPWKKTVKKRYFDGYHKNLAHLGKLLYEGRFVAGNPSFMNDVENIRAIKAAMLLLLHGAVLTDGSN